ncbi:DUF1214 domain-containing protein [Paraburkholderia sp. RL17-337-BIB-A]|uniref:DUF1214 domain-containing protein n=1 Tax=Paraburkholderia sp. RL17-337-BIB-A TaxID=3031636 RepID=UPI0038B6E4F1
MDGGKTYRLHIAANVPAQQFWAVTVYDLDTAEEFGRLAHRRSLQPTRRKLPVPGMEVTSHPERLMFDR